MGRKKKEIVDKPKKKSSNQKKDKNNSIIPQNNYPIREREQVSKKIIVHFYAHQVKTLNGSPAGSTTSYFLELEPVEYSYKTNPKKKKEEQEETNSEVEVKDNEEEAKKKIAINLLKIYFIKGIRGWFRDAGTNLCISYLLEVCHTTDKETDKHGRSFQSDLLHPSGKCEQFPPKKIYKEEKPSKEEIQKENLEFIKNNRCIISYVYGNRGTEGKSEFDIDPIGDIKHKTAELPFPIQNVKIRIDNRHSSTITGKVAQDFHEQFFTGKFYIEIDVTKCELHEIGFLFDSLKLLKKLGRAKNAGYGQVKVEGYKLVERKIEYQESWNDDKEMFELKKIPQDTNISKEIIPKAKQEWLKYVAEQQKKHSKK